MIESQLSLCSDGCDRLVQPLLRTNAAKVVPIRALSNSKAQIINDALDVVRLLN